jgi:quinol monooxygenase YgiN
LAVEVIDVDGTITRSVGLDAASLNARRGKTTHRGEEIRCRVFVVRFGDFERRHRRPGRYRLRISALLAERDKDAVGEENKGCAMREDVYWVCVFKVRPEDFADFEAVVAPLVAATKKEPGALAYEYSVSDDRSTVHIIEHYRDSAAVVAHTTGTFVEFAEKFGALATPAGFTVYGDPSPEARAVLDSQNAIYMKPFDGFTR